MAPPKKYFTEEERRAAARASARRSYYKRHPLKRKRQGRKTKKAGYNFKYYWRKRADELGYDKDDWRLVYKAQRAARRHKHDYYSDEEYQERYKDCRKKYYEKHKNDPGFIERIRGLSKKWREEHPEKNRMYVRRWCNSHKDYLKDYYSTLYSNKKRAERQRMLMAF